MDDLISRQAAITAIEKNMYPDFACSLNVYKGHYTEGLKTAVTAVDNLPSVEPERKTGKWVSRENEPKHRDWVSCSRCTGIFDYRWKFCPNCGARMEE